MAQSGGAEALGLFGIDQHHPSPLFKPHVPDHDRRSRKRDEGIGAIAHDPEKWEPVFRLDHAQIRTFVVPGRDSELWCAIAHLRTSRFRVRCWRIAPE